MRIVLAILMLTGPAWAQFKTNAPLVIAPTTVTDSKGRYVDGLTPQDLILYDNNVPQAIQMDWMTFPIDQVVAVQTSSNSGAVIDKLGGTGIAARFSGLRWGESLALGSLMNTRGLMELVVLNIGLDIRIISPAIFSMMVVMAVTTTMMAPPLLGWFHPTPARLQRD